MNFFDTRLIKIRETIQNLSSASAPSMASPVPDGVDMLFRPAICLDYFTPIKLNEFYSWIGSSKNSSQSGFRPHHSTETALLKVLNDLLLSSDKGFISLRVLLDLSAAFDTIGHLILIDRLKNLVGLSGQALSWIRSYLSERHQFVYTANESSYRSGVRYGIPHGSVLGPLLFSLYMFPLGNIIRNQGINFHCYADDTQLYISAKPDTIAKQSTMEACLKDMKEWIAHNFLLLNSGKTEILVVSPKSIRNKMPDISTTPWWCLCCLECSHQKPWCNFWSWALFCNS